MQHVVYTPAADVARLVVASSSATCPSSERANATSGNGVGRGSSTADSMGSCGENRLLRVRERAEAVGQRAVSVSVSVGAAAAGGVRTSCMIHLCM